MELECTPLLAVADADREAPSQCSPAPLPGPALLNDHGKPSLQTQQEGVSLMARSVRHRSVGIPESAPDWQGADSSGRKIVYVGDAGADGRASDSRCNTSNL